MNVCMQCETAPTASALCAECKAENRAARAAANGPIWAARQAEQERAEARSRAAWEQMLAAHA